MRTVARMTWSTTDLSDEHPDAQASDSGLHHFGGSTRFDGRISTVRVYEDNVLVRKALETIPAGSVLVVDGAGSTRCALVGDRLAAIAIDRSLGGVVLNACVRDAARLRDMNIGVMAIGAVPRRSSKTGSGFVDVPVSFFGMRFDPGSYLYADDDGIVVLADRA